MKFLVFLTVAGLFYSALSSKALACSAAFKPLDPGYFDVLTSPRQRSGDLDEGRLVLESSDFTRAGENAVVVAWFRKRYRMRPVPGGESLLIEGPGFSSATFAGVNIDGHRVNLRVGDDYGRWSLPYKGPNVRRFGFGAEVEVQHDHIRIVLPSFVLEHIRTHDPSGKKK